MTEKVEHVHLFHFLIDEYQFKLYETLLKSNTFTESSSI